VELADFAEYKARIASPNQTVQFAKNTLYVSGGTLWSSFWNQNGWFNGAPLTIGTTPGAATTLDRSSAGAVGQRNPAVPNNLRMWVRAIQGGLSLGIHSSIMIVDRLAHSGGLSGLTLGAQTTNLPTPALTRYSSGVGVYAGIEIYTQIGLTPTTLSVSYTDDAGNAGQISPAIDIGNTSRREAQRFLPLPFRQGDGGIRSIESVTLAASTGTAGNFGVTLFVPLLVVPIRVFADLPSGADPLRQLGLLLPEVRTGACLSFMGIATGQISTQIEGELCFMEPGSDF
jgi:hypothetical protein